MAKIAGNEIRPGTMIEHQGGLWIAVKTQAVKPGKGGAYNQVELKNVINGTKLNERFRSDETVEEIHLEKKDFQFLYANGDMLTFMDMETYDQIELAARFRRRAGAVPAGRHEGHGADATRAAHRHRAAAACDARSHRSRSGDEGRYGGPVLQGRDAGERHAHPGAALHRGGHEDRSSPPKTAPT